MGTNDAIGSFDFDSMVSFVSSILSELNIGLLIYHLENPTDPHSLRLAYANRVASEYTRADLSSRVGKRIGEAFPGLSPDLPALYAEVVQTQRSRNLGATSYGGDDEVGKGYFSVKAFPMPNDCVGIVFENIAVRKQLEELIRKERGH